jgi:cytochrome c oxidase subunit II
MTMTRRSLGLLLAGVGALLVVGPATRRLFGYAPTSAGRSAPAKGQEQAPNRREFTITARDFHFAPDRIEVMRDDLVKLTVRSEDVAHSFTIDEYRIVKRVPAGGATTFEFRADRAGTFPFYCNLTSEPGHTNMKGQLVVRST